MIVYYSYLKKNDIIFLKKLLLLEKKYSKNYKYIIINN